MLLGHRIGPFRVEKELGGGAMGTVYLAVHGETGQRVAIKIVAPGLAGNETSLLRFKREATMLKKLDHPNIVRFVASGKIARAILGRRSMRWSTSKASRSTRFSNAANDSPGKKLSP